MGKYLISVDIEGITGVATRDFSSSSGSRYSWGCRLMAQDVNATIKGILCADPQAQIIVRDAHGKAINLDINQLHPKAQLLQGWDGSTNMVFPVDQTFSAVLLVGYHAGALNTSAVLSHNYNAGFIKVNDLMITETGLAALYAGHHSVPVIFLSGDDQAVLEAKKQIPHAVLVEVKKSINRHSALSLSVEEASRKIEKGAEEAVRALASGKMKPLSLQIPLRVVVGFHSNSYVPSEFQDLMDLLSFDSTYQFNKEKLCIEYTAHSQLEAYQRYMVLDKLSRRE